MLGAGALGGVTPWLTERYIRLTHRSIRWQWEGRGHFDAVLKAREPVIFCFWHSRILMMCPAVEESTMPVAVMISNNRDGEIISRTVARFGAQTIRGSTRDPRKTGGKGGGRALLEALDFLKQGGSVAITPDGPRGPRMRAQYGAAYLAAQSGRRVLPAAFSTSRGRMLRSWDRFLLPVPFGRGAYVVGEPISAPDATDDAAVEVHRLQVETAISRATLRADALVDRETPAPGDEPER